jgi:hypothetical protein
LLIALFFLGIIIIFEVGLPERKAVHSKWRSGTANVNVMLKIGKRLHLSKFICIFQP